MNVAALLHRLETEQLGAAREAMERPGGREAFDYGRAVGFYAGLAHAKLVIDQMLSEEAERRNRM